MDGGYPGTKTPQNRSDPFMDAENAPDYIGSKAKIAELQKQIASLKDTSMSTRKTLMYISSTFIWRVGAVSN